MILIRSVLESLVSDWSILCEYLHYEPRQIVLRCRSGCLLLKNVSNGGISGCGNVGGGGTGGGVSGVVWR